MSDIKTTAATLARLEAQIAAVTPIVGMSADLAADKSTWQIFREGQPPVLASSDPAVWAVVQAFDPTFVPIPDISKRQALLWLLSVGKAEADVIAALNSITDATAKNQALIDWNYPDRPFQRANPLFDQLGAQLGLKPNQLDDAFRAAALL